MKKKKGFSCCRVIHDVARESSPLLSHGVNQFPPPEGVTECVVHPLGMKFALVWRGSLHNSRWWCWCWWGEAICLIDVNAWYVPSVSSRQALRGLVPRREMYSPWPVSAAEGQHTTGGNGNIYVLLLHTLPGARERGDKSPAGVIYRLGSADNTGAFSSSCNSPLFFVRLCLVSAAARRFEKLLSVPADRHFDSDREIKVAAQMKRQMSCLLQTGRRMRQMVSLCRARAQSLGLSSCSVISIKEKAAVSTEQKRPSVWQGLAFNGKDWRWGHSGAQLYSIRPHYPPDMDISPLKRKF